jgi:tetratricopeptide (TPR) repeat protein
MRNILTIFAALCLISPAFGAGGGGSFPSTVPVSKDPAVEADYAQGEYLVKAEKYEEAIPLLKKVVAKEPKHTDALNYLGYCHRKLGKLDEAKAYYEEALKLDPNHLGALEYQGELFLMLKDLPKAEANLAKLVTLCPQGCEQREDLEDAIAAYKAAKP